MQRAWNVVCVLLLILSMAACDSLAPTVQEGEVVIPFEEIFMSTEGSAYESQEPKLFLATTPEELSEIKALASSVPVPEIEQVDLSKYALLALFRGIQPSTNHKVVIETIHSRGDTLVVRAQFWEPAPGQTSQAVETSPYYIVKVMKSKFATGVLKLELQSYPTHQ